MSPTVPRKLALTGDCRIARVQRKLVDHDLRGLPGSTVAIACDAVVDCQIADGERVRAAAWSAVGASAGELPIALARGIRFQGDDRIDQLEADDFEMALQQRQQLDLGFDALGRDHLRRFSPHGITEAHIVDQQLGFQRQLEVDAARISVRGRWHP